MKEWRVLVNLEYEWRIFRFYGNVLNWFVKNGMKLSSPVLCFLNRKLDKHCLSITDRKNIFEKQTGEVIVFYSKL